MDWPADHVERRPIAALVPYEKNSRSHSPAQIAQIAASIKQWGWTVPVLVDETGGLIAGHARIAAARLLGLVDAPVMVARGWRRDDGTPIAGRAVGKPMNDDRSDWREAWSLFLGDVAYVWHADLRARSVVESLEAADFAMRAQIIWAKSRFAIGRGDYHFQHEPCWYAVRKGKVGHWASDRKQTTLWDISHTKSETGHSTQKPVECMKRPIENNSVSGDAIYEPFSGSGTTIIAAEMTGRVCLALELSPEYIDVAVLRWQAFTGSSATLDGDGRFFADIAKERVPAGAISAVGPIEIEPQRKTRGRPKAAAI